MGEIRLLSVRQWLPEWDNFSFDAKLHQRKPSPEFYLASIPASTLRRLAYVGRRRGSGQRLLDLGIQRAHETKRSEEIRRFVDAGYPWASLAAREQERYPSLRKPGWLPTAIVANVLGAQATRADARVHEKDIVTIKSEDGPRLVLPEGAEDPAWALNGTLHPIEIIDGQHRLLAFNEDDPLAETYDLPVVLFNDLDISWQAYLFWTINIRPKRINQSFAFDLYPLLRTQDWLERADGPAAYREARAQELTEALWSHPQSPWRDRISMLSRERGKVSQAAWIRSLTLTFLKPWEGARSGPGGLYGAQIREADTATVLSWNRPQQAAYLILLWTDLRHAIERSGADWIHSLMRWTPPHDVPEGHHPAFAGTLSLLNTDQGVRGALHVMNDVSFVLAERLHFADWHSSWIGDYILPEDIDAELTSLRRASEIKAYSVALAEALASFDWRSAQVEDLSPIQRNQQLVFRTGTGYKEFRLALLRHLADAGDRTIQEAAKNVQRSL